MPPLTPTSTSELRWNPLLEEWTAIAAHRQERPQMPKDWCPFCPGSGRVPAQYDVYLYPNDFPTFASPTTVPATLGFDQVLYRTTPAEGKCDVVLYHPDHNTSLAELSVEHICKVVALWRGRFNELRANVAIKYIFIFENKGEVIGVTMPHPHGQIYSFPYVPPKIDVELKSCARHFEKHQTCLLCDIVADEIKFEQRLVAQNDSFVAFIPFFARWPYEVHIYSKRHLQYITELSAVEDKELAAILKTVTQKYDRLFGFSFPYMMVMHQAPVNNGAYPYYHFHIEFYPPHRSKTKLKYLAGCESGAGTFINDTVPEEKAKELREISPHTAA